MRRFYGKFRGKVANNIDPLQLGRLQVSVPALMGDGRLSWAMPSVPYAGNKVGWFALPPLDANIWVEFEGGDLDYPIWTGCFWAVGEVPVPPPSLPFTKVFKTDTTTITVDDTPGVGGVTIEVKPPAVQVALKMQFSSQGIKISCPPASIELQITGIDLQIPPAEVKLAPTSIELSSAPSKIQLTNATIDLGIGAASVKLNPVSVNVNNGALEVT